MKPVSENKIAIILRKDPLFKHQSWLLTPLKLWSYASLHLASWWDPIRSKPGTTKVNNPRSVLVWCRPSLTKQWRARPAFSEPPLPPSFPGLAFDLLRKTGFGIFHKGAALGKSKSCQSKLFMRCVSEFCFRMHQGEASQITFFSLSVLAEKLWLGSKTYT